MTEFEPIGVDEPADLEFDDESEDDGCPFCLGRAAAHGGESDDTNPFPKVDLSDGSVEWFETDRGLWLCGHSVGAQEPGGLRWYEQPGRENDQSASIASTASLAQRYETQD